MGFARSTHPTSESVRRQTVGWVERSKTHHLRLLDLDYLASVSVAAAYRLVSNRKRPVMSATAPATEGDDTPALLHRCAGGDRVAFRLLYERWGNRLYGIALRITRQAALAADATQDAFVQIWQQAHRFDPERGGPEAWLVGIVRYRALDIVRRRSREVPGYEPAEHRRRISPTPSPAW